MLDVLRQKTHHKLQFKIILLFNNGVVVTNFSDIPKGWKATELGELPEEWNIVNLGEVIQKTSTFNPKNNPNYEFDYIDVSSVSSDTLTIENTTHCIAHSCSSRARKIVEENDVIFATVRPTLRRVSLVPKKLNNHVCSTAFCVLRSNPKKIESSFLFYAVSYRDFVDRVSEHQRGVAYPAITNKEVHKEIIPLPPLPEQHAIATTLRTVQEAKERTDAVIAATKALKAAMMKHLFTYGPVSPEDAERVALRETEIGQVPEEWKLENAKDQAILITKGASPKWQGFEYCDKGIIFVRSQNIGWGTLELKNVAHLPFSFNEKEKKSIIKKDDVLINLVGASIGRVAIADETIQGGNLNQAVGILRLNMKFDPKFIILSLPVWSHDL